MDDESGNPCEVVGDEAGSRWPGKVEIDRAVLSDSSEGRVIAAELITTFGAFVDTTVRPILRDVAQSGGDPQLLMNGLAQMLRSVADSVEGPAPGPPR